MKLLFLSAAPILNSTESPTAPPCAETLLAPEPERPIDDRRCPQIISLASPIHPQCCENFIANHNVTEDSSINNFSCQQLCRDDPDNFRANHPECIYQSWHPSEQGYAKIEYDPSEYLCYSNWVYGYFEPLDLAGYKRYGNVSSPVECQGMCQDDADCISFLWYAPLRHNLWPYDNLCVFKNQKHIEGALAENFDYDTVTKNTQYCSANQGYECRHDYICTPDLLGIPRRTCVYESYRHISGPKYCKVKRHSPEHSTEHFCYPSEISV